MSEKRLGVMLDCSRNAVYSVKAVKRLMDYMVKMGYNMLMLYTEDTYEVDGHPLFGYMRGRYSTQELTELVQYGEEKGIEMIPCIQTLAHVNQLFKYRWSPYQEIRDCYDIMLIDDEKTYELIEAMVKTLRKSFKTDVLHIGMDEAMMVGRGKYLDQHGWQNRFDLLYRHLLRVKAICEKYGFTPIMWSDMFFRLANQHDYYTENPDLITDEIVASLPENIGLVYWDYYHTGKSIYDSMLTAHNKFGAPVWFGGGAWVWTGFTPHNGFSIETIKPAMVSCREHGVENVFFTCWGDDSGEGTVFSVLPSLYYAAELYRGNDDEASIKQGFADIFGIAFDDFMKLDLPSSYTDTERLSTQSPDKMLLYRDIFLPVACREMPTDGSANVQYAAYRDALLPFASSEEFGYLFRSAAALCDVVATKACLTEKVREAYAAKDMVGLKAVAEDLLKAEEKVEVFYQAHRTCWFTEKKGHGFDVQDIRLGGLKMRLRDCRERLEAYIRGEIATIEELEETVVPLDIPFGCFWSSITPNII